MLKKFKQATLKSLKTTGVSTLVNNSRWRRQRLLILAYHGISLSDEHVWNGSQFMDPDVFRNRLQVLRKSGCSVLPLGEAVTRLYADDLPDRAVAITFDDGTSDFYRRAVPILKEFDLPVTLYLTTFYTHYNHPVFDLMCSYLLWKGRDEQLDLKKLIGRDARIDLSTEPAREAVCRQLLAFAGEQKLTAEGKEEFVAALARQLNVDYARLVDQRTMHNLTADEVKLVAESGVDIQLHTHRHRTPLNHKLFMREIEDNRKSIHELTGLSTSHFCYPSGAYNLAFLPWLKEAGIESATTCELGLASPSSNPLLLPRLIDVSALSEIEFEGWLSGIASVLPRRRETKESAA